jgi:Putative adhesin Stv domain
MPIQATKDDVVLSGHGAVDVGSGETAVPGGFELVVLAPPGASISDRLGGMIERGEKVNKLKLPTKASGSIDFEPIVYAADKMAPNYILYPPTGLVLKPGVPHMLGVAKATPLSELWVRIKTFNRTGQVTRCFWCACAAITGATNPTVDAG